MSKGNRKRRRELGLLPEPQKCADRSSRTGEPCKNAPINGSAVCRWHGGAAPQVLAKARERLALAADDAVSVLIRLMADPKVSPSDRRQAAAAILDRAGIRSGAELEITVAPWMDALEGIIAEVPDDSALTRTHALTYEGRDREALPLLTNQAGSPLDIVDAEVIEEPDDRPLPVTAPVDGRPDARARSRVARMTRN